MKLKKQLLLQNKFKLKQKLLKPRPKFSKLLP